MLVVGVDHFVLLILVLPVLLLFLFRLCLQLVAQFCQLVIKLML